MSTIQREIVVSSIEPAQLSLRIPRVLETVIAFSFVNQDGSPVNVDLDALLRIVGRSDARVIDFPVVSTDATNGKAEAVITAGALTDPNGYHARLFSRAAAPELLAMGVIRPIFALAVDPPIESA
jgi:hypothetical protein